MKLADLDTVPETTSPVWVDSVNAFTRADGVMTVIFTSLLPDQQKNIEVCRVTFSHELAKRTGEMLLRVLKKHQGRDV